MSEVVSDEKIVSDKDLQRWQGILRDPSRDPWHRLGTVLCAVAEAMLEAELQDRRKRRGKQK